SKVDRSAAYAARYIAKNLVAAGVADECLVQLAYAIGVAKPVSVFVDTYGTAKNGLKDGEIAKKVAELFDLRPAKIIKKFGLKNPIYTPTASYGHMGRTPYTKQMLKSCDFTIIAHCDLIKKQNGPKVKSPLFDQNSDWYKKEIALLADKIASAGVVAEVNVGGMARGYMATPFPHGELLSLLIQKNVPLTLSSDSHSAETLDFAFDETVQMLKKAGCKELAFIEGKNSFKMQPL
ncbi:MAG: methionine adenosyltransferase domain-containing protein, partial [Treponema sp.]|nr:methionine adenosyltransferase domain-containing protein [Treponema sp.]